MRKLVYLVATTVDGYIASAPSNNPDFFFADGPQAPDLLTEFPEMIPGPFRAVVGLTPETPNKRFDTVLMGRTTYEIGVADGISSPYPHLEQIVFSESLAKPDDHSVDVWDGDAVRRLRELKSKDGADIWLCGGGTLAASLMDDIDELILKVSPLILGGGVPLFAGRVGPRQLALTDHRIYDNGFAVMRYQQSDIAS